MLPVTRSTKESNYLKKSYFIYGEPKSGKTTIASKFGDDDQNKVLFFATESGHKFTEVYKYKNNQGGEPTNWVDFKDCCRELAQGGHDFKMLSIDTVDNLWDWCSTYIKSVHNIQHESDLGFGKGYTLIKEEFVRPINYLSQSGMGLLFISHAKSIDKELGNRKITYTTSTLQSTASKIIHGLCDYIFYFHTDYEGERLIRTKGLETVNCGDRSGNLPELLPMDAETLISYLKGEC